MKFLGIGSILALFLITAIIACNLLVIYTSKDDIYPNITNLPNNRVCLVLGTTSRIRKNVPNPHFTNRMTAAAELYKQKKIQRIIVSGDNRTMRYNEPKDMKNKLIKLGVKSKHIYQDFAGLRTLDSIVRAKEIFSQTKLTIVTDRFHLYRALYIARASGIDAIGYPCRKNPHMLGKTLVREYFARVKALLDIYILSTQPRHAGEKIEIK